VKRKTQIVLALAIFATFGVALFLAVRGGGKAELAELKAKLRAQGEKLTYEEMGYPTPTPDQNRFASLETNIRLLPKAAWFGKATDWQYAAPRPVAP
jgi:hypothetical protein